VRRENDCEGKSLGAKNGWERKIAGKENSLDAKDYWAGEFAESRKSLGMKIR